MNKPLLRKAFRQTLPPQSLRCAGLEALNALEGWSLYQSARHVASYWPLSWEMDVRPINEAILSSGKCLYLPRITGSGEMVFCKVKTLADLTDGPWGLREPAASCPICSAGQMDLMLVPCEALDVSGTRLGKGGGYYDRYLAQISCVTVAPLLAHQFSTEPLPRLNHDIPIQYYILGDVIAPSQRSSAHG